jgi:hypothetical protein
VAESFADTTFGLTKEFAVSSQVVLLAAILTAFSILKMTTKRWFGGISLVNSLLLLEFPGSLLTSDVFLLKYPNKFLGHYLQFWVSVITLTDTCIWLSEGVPGRW